MLLQSNAIFRFVDLLGEGQIGGLYDGDKSIYLNGTPLQAADDSYNFEGVTIESRVGTAGQDSFKDFAAAENEEAVNTQLTMAGTVTRTVTDTDVDAVRLTFSISQLYKQKNNGQLRDGGLWLTVDVQADSVWHTDVFGPPLADSSPLYKRGQTRSGYQWSVELDLRQFGDPPYDIRIYQAGGVEHGTDPQYPSLVYWQSYTELKHARFRYPYSAAVAGAISAQQFGNQIPERIYGLKGRLIQYPDNYTPATRAYSGSWAGTFTTGLTDNPAWVLYDLLAENRACAGIAAAYIDKWTLYTIAQYCDALVDDGLGGSEPRFVYNGVIETRDDALRVAAMIASCFRGMLYEAGGQVQFFQDAPSDRVWNFANADVEDGQFVYQGSGREEIHTAAYVTYNDPTNFGRPKTVYVQHDAAQQRYGYQEARITAVGCYSPGQAVRIGKWLLDTEYNEQEQVRFVAGFKALDLRPGHVMRIADQFYGAKRFGFKVVSAAADQVVVEGEFDPEIGETYALEAGYRDADDEPAVETQDITDADYDAETGYTTLTLASAYTYAAPAANTTVVVTQYNDPDGGTRDFRCLRVDEREFGAYEVQGMLYDGDKYARVESDLDFDAPESPPSIAAVPPPTDIQAEYFFYNDGGSNLSGLQVSWLHPAAVPAPPVRWQPYYRVQLIRTDTDPDLFADDQTVSDPGCQFKDVDAGTYTIKVRTEIEAGHSEWLEYTDFVVGSATAPPVPTNLQVKGGGTAFAAPDCEIEWDDMTDPDAYPERHIKDYKVEVKTAADVLLRTEWLAVPGYLYSWAQNAQDNGGTPIATVKFVVSTRDAWNTLSATAASLTAVNAAPAAPASLAANAWMGGVEFVWDANAELDFAYFLYRIKVETDAWGDWVRTLRPGHVKQLTPTEKDDHGAGATIYIEVKAVDTFGSASGASSVDEAAGALAVKIADVSDYQLTPQKFDIPLPLVDGLTITNNSPSAGYVAWSAFNLYLSGTLYEIAAGNSNSEFICFKDLATTLAATAAHPSVNWADWDPEQDFLIVWNNGGTGKKAWSTLMNLVATRAFIGAAAIGTANIDNLAVTDAKINDLSGAKILVTSSIGIGSATWQANGIQIQYNGGDPRAYIGDGGDIFFQFTTDPAALLISGADITIRSGNGITVEDGGDLILQSGSGTSSKIEFQGQNYAIKLETEYANDRLVASPDTAGHGHIYFGATPAAAISRFSTFHIYTKDGIRFDVDNGSNTPSLIIDAASNMVTIAPGLTIPMLLAPTTMKFYTNSIECFRLSNHATDPVNIMVGGTLKKVESVTLDVLLNGGGNHNATFLKVV